MRVKGTSLASFWFRIYGSSEGCRIKNYFSEISISEEELFGEDTNLLGNVI